MKYYICKNESQVSISKPIGSFCFENLKALGPIMVGLIVESEYEIMSNTFTVFDSHACTTVSIMIGNNGAAYQLGQLRKIQPYTS